MIRNRSEWNHMGYNIDFSYSNLSIHTNLNLTVAVFHHTYDFPYINKIIDLTLEETSENENINACRLSMLWETLLV